MEWVILIIILLFGLWSYYRLYNEKADLQHSLAYARYLLIGISMIFTISIFPKSSNEIFEKLLPNYGKYILIFIIIDALFMFVYHVLKKDNYSLFITEYLYILLYICIGIFISLRISKYEKASNVYFALICIIIFIQACVLLALNHYSKADKDIKSFFFSALLFVALMALFVEKLEFKSIRIYKFIIEGLLFLVIAVIFSFILKKNRNIKKNSLKWIKIKK